MSEVKKEQSFSKDIDPDKSDAVDAAKARSEFLKAKRKNHRQRVKNAFYKTGFESMEDHQILEMLLFFGIPQKDTKQIAYELIDRFGDLAGVFEADRSDLAKIKGMTDNAACLINMILPLYKHYTESLSERKAVETNPKDVADFLRPKFLAEPGREQLFVLCYDFNDVLLSCKRLSIGDISSSLFDMRALASVVLETKCQSIILAHNHPHGISQPSKDDIDVTSKAKKMLDTLKVRLIDHIIVSDSDYTSLANHPKSMPVFYNLQDFDPIEHIKKKYQE